jgi:hypothetical protein
MRRKADILEPTPNDGKRTANAALHADTQSGDPWNVTRRNGGLFRSLSMAERTTKFAVNKATFRISAAPSPAPVSTAPKPPDRR